MRTSTRILSFVLVLLLAFWFTVVNAGESVVLDLVILRVVAPLPLVVFGSILTGMVAVMAVGLRADLRTRRMLARYREVLEGEDPTRGPPIGSRPQDATLVSPSEEVSPMP